MSVSILRSPWFWSSVDGAIADLKTKIKIRIQGLTMTNWEARSSAFYRKWTWGKQKEYVKTFCSGEFFSARFEWFSFAVLYFCAAFLLIRISIFLHKSTIERKWCWRFNRNIVFIHPFFHVRHKSVRLRICVRHFRVQIYSCIVT